MANDGASHLYAVAIRVARLDALGNTPAGPSNMYVTDTVVKVGFTPEYEESAEVVRKNGQGNTCLSVPPVRTLKRLTIDSLEICGFDPELTEILSGGSLLMSTGGTPSTIGYAYEAVGANPVPNGVSVELWTRRYVGDSFVGYAWWALPRLYLTKDAREFSAGEQTNEFKGYGTQNPNWGNGPNNDWTAASTRVAQWVQTATAPAATVGYVPTPTQVP